MSLEESEELARELEEFGYRETSDPDEADRRRFYKVEKWDAAEMHVEALLYASNVGVRFRKIEIEYNRSLKVEGYDLMLAVRYKGKPYSVVIPRAVCDDFGRLRRSTESQRLKAVQDHRSQILRAAEEKIIRGVAKDRFELEHADFPAGTF